MSFLLFLLLLLAGIAIVFLGSKTKGTGAIILFIVGGILILIGGYGVFTSFL